TGRMIRFRRGAMEVFREKARLWPVAQDRGAVERGPRRASVLPLKVGRVRSVVRLPPKEDIEKTSRHVRSVPKAEIRTAARFLIRSPRRRGRARPAEFPSRAPSRS